MSTDAPTSEAPAAHQSIQRAIDEDECTTIPKETIQTWRALDQVKRAAQELVRISQDPSIISEDGKVDTEALDRAQWAITRAVRQVIDAQDHAQRMEERQKELDSSDSPTT